MTDQNVPQTPSSPPQPPSGAPRTSGMAIASLICAIFGFFLPALIAAIILGVIARKQIAESNGALAGRGLATAALAVSACWIALICLGIALSVILPNVVSARSASIESTCYENLARVGAAIRRY